MRYTLLLLIIFSACTANAQKFEKNETDKFTNAKRLTTSNVRLKTGMLAFLTTYTEDEFTFYYITLFGSVPEARVIGTDERVIFLLDNDSTVTGYSTGIQSYDIGMGTHGKMYRHQYKLQESDIKLLAEHDIKSIRKYGGDIYADVDIPEKNQGDIKKLAKMVLQELSK